MWVDVLNQLGYRRVIFRSDNEPAILAFLRRVRETWTGEVVPETSTEHDPQSNGAAEASVGIIKALVRTQKIALQQRIGCEVVAGHPLIGWMVRYAGSTYRRFKVGADGKTPYERSVGRRLRWESRLVAQD